MIAFMRNNTMILRKLALILLAFPLLILLIVSCSDNNSRADSRARVYFDKDSLVSSDWVFITLYDGETTWQFGPDDLIADSNDTTLFSTPEVNTLHNGTLEVIIRLDSGEEPVFSEGTFKAPLSPNWRWSFELIRSRVDPITSCDGCWSTREFEINDPAFEDELVYAIWYGRGP